MPYVLLAAAIVGLTACSQFSEKDRALLMETHTMAQEAKNQAVTATDEARRARDAANKAAADAKTASDKADRIFRQSQSK